MTSTTQQALIRKYKSVYGMPDEAPITFEMVMKHWELERKLTQELLASQPQDRWAVFERNYSILYSELSWLNELGDAVADVSDEYAFADWPYLIGPAPRRVYEIGSGKGRLATFLATKGYICKATEVTRERGERLAAPHPNLSWGTTDGVHLARFEEAASYDAVISDQVVEHLHPDDLVDHFRGALAILKPGGRYALATPHRLFGPMDVSQVFGLETPEGMHLKEYTYAELRSAALEAGFSRAYALLRVPRRFRSLLRGAPRPRLSRAFLVYLIVLEGLIGLVPGQSRRRKASRMAKVLLFDGVLLVAERGLSPDGRKEATQESKIFDH